MKTLLSLLLLFSSLTVIAQTETKTLTFDQEINLTPNLVELKSSELVSPYTYNRIIFGELTQLLLGNSTAPSEGIEATFDGDKSNIKLSGIITSNKHFLVSIEGDLSASDQGIYFIDEQNGSKNAKLTLNFYKPFYGSSSYDNPMTAKKTQQVFYVIEESKRILMAKLIKNYIYSRYLLKKSGYPVKPIDLSGFTEDIKDFDYEIYFSGYPNDSLKLETLELKSFIKANQVNKDRMDYENVMEIKNKKGETVLIPNKIEESENMPEFDVIKVMKLHEKTVNSMDSISNKLVEVESELSQPYWNRKRFWYLGGSPFYEREEIKNVYNPDEMASFDDNFNDTIGDLFGVDFQAGFFYQSKKASYKNFYTKMFFGRVTLNASRGSNRSEFDKETFSSTPTPVGTGSIFTPNALEGNINTKGNDYNFGEKYGVGAEVYWFPFTRYGVFGQVGYNTINFSPREGEDIERYNMRLGVLINIKSKKKNFATLQLFADRSDLSLSPNGNDKNLRFGFKVGVPFNFREKL